MTPEQLRAIRERAEKATPGPWVAARETEYFTAIERPDGRILGSVGGDGYTDNSPEHAEIEANAVFIAHAREEIPALLEHIRELRAEADDTGYAITSLGYAQEEARKFEAERDAALARVAVLEEALRKLLRLAEPLPWVGGTPSAILTARHALSSTERMPSDG